MKTLNEQVYEYLLTHDKKLTTVDVTGAPEFAKVPPMVVNKALLAVCGEGLAYYSIKDGKMYFSTNPGDGRNQIGSQENLTSLNSKMGLLAALMGGGGNAAGSLAQVFPEEESSMDAVMDGMVFSASEQTGRDYRISFPELAEVKQKPDDAHDFSGLLDEEQPIVHMSVSTKPMGGDFSRELVKCLLKSIASKYVNQILKCPDVTVAYCKEDFDAYYIPVYHNTFIFIGRPDGMHILRIDFACDEELPSEKAVCRFIERWIDTYQYTGEKKYLEIKPLNRPELLANVTTDKGYEELKNELEAGINDFDRQVNMIKQTWTFDKVQDKPIGAVYKVRKALAEEAMRLDSYIVQVMETIRYCENAGLSEEKMNAIYYMTNIVLNRASDISAVVKVPVSGIPYNSATDVAIGSDSSEDYLVEVFPKHYKECLKFMTIERAARYPEDEALKEEMQVFYNNMLAYVEGSEKVPVYYPDFKLEGTMLAAYLGHEKEVVIPDEIKIRSIGDYAFKDCKELETINLGEGVTSLGFFSFFGCDNLKTMITSQELSKISGPLCMVGGDRNLTIHGYKDTFAEKYAKENKIKFKVIEEPNLDCLIELKENQYDIYNNFALPKMEGFITTEDVTAEERKQLSENASTSHIRYSAVPTDNPKKFIGYNSAMFSFSVVADPVDVQGKGLEIIGEIEQRFDQPHVHDTYRACTADDGKVIVRYDLVREVEGDGVSWTNYAVVFADKDRLIISQVFINGDYSHRQQEFAIQKFAGAILTKKSFQEAEKKQKEEKREEYCKKAVEILSPRVKELFEQTTKEITEKRFGEIEAQTKAAREKSAADIERLEAQIPQIEKKYSEEEAALQKEQSEQTAYLGTLGFFKMSEKKSVKARLEEIAARLAAVPSERLAEKDKIRNQIRDKKTALTKEEEQIKQTVKTKYPAPVKAVRDTALVRKISDCIQNQPKEMESLMKFTVIDELTLLGQMLVLAEAGEVGCFEKSGKVVYEYYKVEHKLSAREAESRMTAVQIANNEYKDAILEFLRRYGRATISEVMESCDEVANLSNQRVAAIMRQMRDEGQVIRTEIHRKAYFEAAW